jgi:hypothetical protein
MMEHPPRTRVSGTTAMDRTMTEHHDGLLEQIAYCVTDDVELGVGAEVTDKVF